MSGVRSLITVVILTLLGGCATPQPKIPAEQAAALTQCDLSLAQVADNLRAAGYAFEHQGPSELETGFLKIEAETEKYMLGTLMEERFRKYRVRSQAPGVVFEVQYKRLVYPHESDRDQSMRTHIAPLALTQNNQALWKRIHTEVCAQPTRPAMAPMPMPSKGQSVNLLETLNFIQRRCDEGDPPACAFLEARGLR